MSKKKNQNDNYGLAIGFLNFGLAMIVGQFNGGYGMLNPAISVASNIVNAFPIPTGFPWNPLALFSAFMYFVVDMSAGLIAGLLYYYIGGSMKQLERK